MGMKLDHCHRASCKQIIEALKAECAMYKGRYELAAMTADEAMKNVAMLGAENDALKAERDAALAELKDCRAEELEYRSYVITLKAALREAKDTIEWMNGCTSPAQDEVDKAIATINEVLKDD
jgi:uncharacterized coiled-coil DUF342 family protein